MRYAIVTAKLVYIVTFYNHGMEFSRNVCLFYLLVIHIHTSHSWLNSPDSDQHIVICMAQSTGDSYSYNSCLHMVTVVCGLKSIPFHSILFENTR